MSYPDVFPSGPVTAPARPARCTCASPVAATLAGTLACPLAWYEQPDGTWIHTRRINAGAGLRAGARTGGLA